ncbi:MAG: hypothetical protein O9972_34710, partial [Burkholderiales bacterium]|nr:hypothetical protein [Burkholderiales bacterium]
MHAASFETRASPAPQDEDIPFLKQYLVGNPTTRLILRRPRSGRLEGRRMMRRCNVAPFETRASPAPQDEDIPFLKQYLVGNPTTRLILRRPRS